MSSPSKYGTIWLMKKNFSFLNWRCRFWNWLKNPSWNPTLKIPSPWLGSLGTTFHKSNYRRFFSFKNWAIRKWWKVLRRYSKSTFEPLKCFYFVLELILFVLSFLNFIIFLSEFQLSVSEQFILFQKIDFEMRISFFKISENVGLILWQIIVEEYATKKGCFSKWN